jgi:hypothetical protein
MRHDLVGKLESVSGEEARIAVAGTASGIDLGAQVKLTIAATGSYQIKQHRLVALEWKQKEERDGGPASPTSTAETTWRLSRNAIAMPKELTDVALVAAKVPEGIEAPPEELLAVAASGPKNLCQLTHARDWQEVAKTNDHLILRLMNRGDWVAQVTITPWTPAEKGKHMTPDEFKQELNETPGWEPEEVREDGEVPSAKGYWIYRTSALGELDGIKVLQNFYVVAGPEGDQAVLAFILRPAQAERLGTQDLKLIDGLSFPPR